VVEGEVGFDAHGRVGQRHAVHVVDGRGREKQEADAPAPGFRPIGAHPFQELPSHARTRSRNLTASSVNALKSFSPFSAVASRGSPTWPAGLCSFVIHPRPAGSNDSPNPTGLIFL